MLLVIKVSQIVNTIVGVSHLLQELLLNKLILLHYQLKEIALREENFQILHPQY